MNPIRVDLPWTALLVEVCIAAVAALGITILIGAEAHAVVTVPMVTGLLTLALLVAGGQLGFGPVHRDAVVTDRPTGLAKEEVADDALAREFAAAQRGRLLTIVLVRLDGLEAYRARHGQAATERLLRASGRAFVRNRRQMDLAAHHGVRTGTFLALLSGTDLEGGKNYVARLRNDLLNLGDLPPVEGVSAGIASFDAKMRSPADLIRAAGEALNRGARRGGRMRVVAGRG